jgi:putative aldouronate transport system permease protein
MKKVSVSERLFNWFNIIFLIIISATMVYPFLNLLAISLSSSGPVLAQKVNLIPVDFTLATYKQLLTEDKMIRTMGNTVYITLVGTGINLLMTILLAYPLSRKYIYIKGVILKMVLFTMLFNGGMIPDYLLIKKLGLIDSLWSLMIPGAISAWNLIILINFFKALPDELEESAKIDGASDLRILLQIVIPLSMHAIATIALFCAVAKWNTFFNAIIYINSIKKLPLQVMLRQIIMLDEAIGLSTDNIVNMPPETKKAAAIFFSVLPILCVYPFLQKYFVKGVMIGSIKG